MNRLAASHRDARRAVTRASSDSPYARIDRYLEGQIARLNIPGAALAIVEGDQITHMRGYGRAGPGGEAPTPQTPFFIGSLTKSFTALAVMQLVEAGKVELDAPVRCYLPWFTLADPRAAGQITVRHLLNQTSGLSTWAGWIPLGDLDHRPGETERLAQSLSTIPLKHPVGSTHEYSNVNYIILGLIIEAIGGSSYSDYVQSHVLDPLGMNHTYFTETEAKQNGLATGYRFWFWYPFTSPNTQAPRSSLPAGMLISSAEDMGRYLIAQLNGGRCGDADILSPAGIAEMHRPAAAIHTMGWSAHYGMGWFNEDVGSLKLVWHGGTLPNFASFLAILPEQKKGIALLINADHFMMNPVITEIGHHLAADLAGCQPPPSPFGFNIAGFVPWATRALLLIPLLQTLGMVSTVRLLQRWRRDPRNRPSLGRLWWQHILLPLIANLGFAAVPVYLQRKKRLGFLLDYFPDFAWTAVVGGAFAGIWALLRAGLVLRAWRK